jgi:coproporphyrinogen III oxidase-like Fe-S oxidoreductase
MRFAYCYHTIHITIRPLQPISLKSQALSFKALPPLSLYIHIPWCVRKCPYCDFNSHEVYTVFFGGGTPSLLSGESITEILRNVRMLLR